MGHKFVVFRIDAVMGDGKSPWCSSSGRGAWGGGLE